MAPRGFKPRAGGRKVAWVGSIPTRSRQILTQQRGRVWTAPVERHGSMAQRRSACAAALLVAAALACASHLPAQQPDSAVIGTATVPIPEAVGPVSPGSAFVRALLLPGWGHASIGSYKRGGFYFATEATTAIMLVRTLRRLAVAKDARDLRESRVREVLVAGGAVPDSLDVLVDADGAVVGARNLVLSRKQQLEDWVALGAFLLLLSGADAFVSAHLRDFPPPVAVDAAIGPRGSIELGLRLPVGPPYQGR